MHYSEIIRENCERHSLIPWWPRFAFHYTDVTNAVIFLIQDVYSVELMRKE
jgi:hypothetical protein